MKKIDYDVQEENNDNWLYSETVKDHFFNPRNFLTKEPRNGEFDAQGIVDQSMCGDVMKVWIKVDKKNNKIKKIGWKTFGCASAIAATSMMSVMVTENGGMTLGSAKKITPNSITKRMGGLPLRKVHCSVLGDQALRKAIDTYKKMNKKKSK
ncbi:iron-sulfur cluster assembly scaffold protein [Patescibacteria group bacterium]|jgi:NifU-like protein involved in Fe-S cluster formation|nr:iron-sulfur cluster assembly scaffold protein [Patescibacteria group bacterium]